MTKVITKIVTKMVTQTSVSHQKSQLPCRAAGRYQKCHKPALALFATTIIQVLGHALKASYLLAQHTTELALVYTQSLSIQHLVKNQLAYSMSSRTLIM